MQIRELQVTYGKVIGGGYGKIMNPSDVTDLLYERIGKEAQEVFVLLILNSRNRVTGLSEVSRGTVTASLVHPREIYKIALLGNASAIIIAHNHPSGDPTPSAEDKGVTERIAKAGGLIGISLLDHIILCPEKGNAYSFTEHNDMPIVKHWGVTIP